MKLHTRRKGKREAAAARQLVYDKLTLPQKVELIKSRRGESKRELAKLMEQV